MNELLEQFVNESRDLIEEASRALLSLEQAPQDREALGALFRCVHTIKGASGLFEIRPFTMAVHAGEDLLDAVRAGDVRFTPALADLLLDLLDAVADWLNALETSGELPDRSDATAEALAEALQSQLAVGHTDISDAVTETRPQKVEAGLQADLPPGAPASLLAAAENLSRVTYQPDRTAFYSGSDPLRTVLTTPDLRWFGPRIPDPLPSLETFDPFEAVLGFDIVTGADQAALETHFLYVEDQVTIAALPGAPGDHCTLSDEQRNAARALVDSQRRLLQANAATTSCHDAVATVLRRIAGAMGMPDVSTRIAAFESDGPQAHAFLNDLIDAMADRLDQPPPLETRPEPSISPADDAPAPELAEVSSAPRKATAIRVDAERIDQLMNLAGELIVAKNALPFLARRAEEISGGRALVREIKAQHDAINRIAEELQSAVKTIRMVPVGSVLGRFNRLVRDLSRKLSKRITLEIIGEDTEADKAVVEELADPMVHLIRNAIDHGLETPEERRNAGKSEVGLIRLTARQQEDSVVIEVADDGRGIDIDRVKAKALEKGVIDADALARLSDDQALQLILTPGLSTREEISDLSGRGVGMDVVASMVRRVGGQIGLQSTPGQGTTVRISLPLSMAVQRLMMVEVDGGLYGVAVEAVVESQRLPRSMIHRHRNDEIAQLRGRIIPLLRLHELFGAAKSEPKDEINILVVEQDGTEVGLVVDRFHAGVDVIVKPMEGILAGAGCYSGTALLGDGSVLLALDLQEVLSCRWN